MYLKQICPKLQRYCFFMIIGTGSSWLSLGEDHAVGLIQKKSLQR